ncbi:MAG: DUF433 domain-containing protein, partial [Anaerolineae bacterium]|nr:DUF433 domain-containing protein [Anaerolineae bacterium]
MEHERIIIDSQVMDGEPVIGGSNVTVASFVETLASALAHAAIREVYPQLSPEDVQAAFAFVQEAVTARRQFAAQQEHLAAERERALAMMRAVVESTADGVLVVSNDNRVMICNQRFESMWKLRPGWYEAQYPEWLYLLARQTQDPVGFIQRVETLNDHPDAEGYDIIELKGDQVFERYATPYAVGGEIVGRVWSFRDVTDRKRADVELRASRARLKAIFDNVAVGIGLVDTEGRYIQTNEQWDLMLNRRRPEDPGTVELDIADQTENPVISRKQLKALIRGEIDAFHTEKRIVREDG